MNNLTQADKEAILQTIVKLSEKDKCFVLGYAAGIVAKAAQMEQKSA